MEKDWDAIWEMRRDDEMDRRIEEGLPTRFVTKAKEGEDDEEVS